MLLSGVCIACFALVRSRSRRHNIRLRVHLPMFAYVVFPMRRCRTAARDLLALPRAVSCPTGQDLDHRVPACLPPAKSFCAPDRRASLFSAPHGKVIRATPHACGVAARKCYAKNVFASLGRPVTARINARMIKYDDFVKKFIIMY